MQHAHTQHDFKIVLGSFGFLVQAFAKVACGGAGFTPSEGLKI